MTTPISDDARVEFRGTASEWFGIWIVNLLLSILTIGVYSAWAKVRTHKYFYQNTYVAGRNFDYHATGMQIFVGRLIVIGAFIVYGVLSAMPIVNIVAVLALVAAMPWLMIRALKFNARMSSWSNVRFGFDASYWAAAKVMILYPIGVALTLFTTLPFLTRAMRGFVSRNHRLGGHQFAFDAPIRPFYVAFFAAGAWVLAVGIVAVAIGWSAIAATPAGAEPGLGLWVAIYLFLFLGYIPASVVYRAFVRNVALNSLSLEGGHEFRSDVVATRLVWIALSNAVAATASLGLLLPWTHVRMHRYLAEHTAFLPNGSLDHFVSDVQSDAGAVGDAYADIEGFDLALPV